MGEDKREIDHMIESLHDMAIRRDEAVAEVERLKAERDAARDQQRRDAYVLDDVKASRRAALSREQEANKICSANTMKLLKRAEAAEAEVKLSRAIAGRWHSQFNLTRKVVMEELWKRDREFVAAWPERGTVPWDWPWGEQAEDPNA